MDKVGKKVKAKKEAAEPKKKPGYKSKSGPSPVLDAEGRRQAKLARDAQREAAKSAPPAK